MMSEENTRQNFWDGKRVLLTGHTGFKGAWLALWLHTLGAKITGIGLPPATTPNLFTLLKVNDLCDNHFVDIRHPLPLADIIKASRPEIVFHLAAQSLVRTSYFQPIVTFSTNVMGTAHLLDALHGLDCVKVAVMVTTDKVYHDNKWPFPYRENDTLGGHDPYSASKAASEMVIASYRDSFLSSQGIAVASARAGNVIGGGDWSADRLIPDAIRAWESAQTLEIRQPFAVRPWQHVLEPLNGYLTLAEKLWQEPQLAGAYNFGPQTYEAATVQQVVEMARLTYGESKVHYGDWSNEPHETSWLALEIAKAKAILGIAPKWSLVETINRTMAWYLAQRSGADALNLCKLEIAEYEARL